MHPDQPVKPIGSSSDTLSFAAGRGPTRVNQASRRHDGMFLRGNYVIDFNAPVTDQERPVMSGPAGGGAKSSGRTAAPGVPSVTAS